MLFPENPEKRPGLWGALKMQLAQEAMCPIIAEGHGDLLVEAKEPDKNFSQEKLDKLQVSPFCRVSVSRGKAVSPHFAGTCDDKVAFITEFLSLPPVGKLVISQEQLKHDLEIAVVNLLFSGGEASMVVVPLNLTPWAMKDVDVNLKPEGLIFTKKTYSHGADW